MVLGLSRNRKEASRRIPTAGHRKTFHAVAVKVVTAFIKAFDTAMQEVRVVFVGTSMAAG
jgi:hypothetical protein